MQIKNGTVSVVNGSASITGLGTTWANGDIQPGQLFGIKDSGIFYTIAAVVSNTQLSLTAPYAGATASGQQYYISTDFTPNRGYPEINKNDWDKEALITQALRKIDAEMQDLRDRIAILE